MRGTIDADLVDSARRDNRVADDLYRAVSCVRRVVRVRLSGYLPVYSDEIDEGCHLAFLKALQTYDAELGSFQAWYYRLCLSTCIGLCREERKRWHLRTTTLPTMDTDSAELDEEDHSSVRSQMLLLRDRVAESSCGAGRSQYEWVELFAMMEQVLSERERQIIDMLCDGMSVREIACSLQMPHTTVHDLIKKIRNKVAPLFR